MTVGITFGTFDLLYSGYIEMLKEAKSKCDYLIVGLHLDPSLERPDKNTPIQSVQERYSELKDCNMVDEIITYSTEKELEDILKTIKVDVRIIGDEYRSKDFTGKLYCQMEGIDIYYNSRIHKLSSSLVHCYNNKISQKKLETAVPQYYDKNVNHLSSFINLFVLKERLFKLS